jgi:hypothetical protein
MIKLHSATLPHLKVRSPRAGHATFLIVSKCLRPACMDDTAPALRSQARAAMVVNPATHPTSSPESLSAVFNSAKHR